ncbi:MAG TPA: ATP-binding protein [Thermoleophilaceae bacterium]|nr:ATP-binding protein [Thermoleophilaceae bacterium]
MLASREQLELRSDPRELATVRRFADGAAARFGLGDGERHDFTFAVNEAVSNAIEHGRPSPTGTIRIHVAEKDGALVFEVEDHGTFAPSPPAIDHLHERGRGLAFMAATVDEVDVRSGASGTVVRLCKRRAAA